MIIPQGDAGCWVAGRLRLEADGEGPARLVVADQWYQYWYSDFLNAGLKHLPAYFYRLIKKTRKTLQRDIDLALKRKKGGGA